MKFTSLRDLVKYVLQNLIHTRFMLLSPRFQSGVGRRSCISDTIHNMKPLTNLCAEITRVKLKRCVPNKTICKKIINCRLGILPILLDYISINYDLPILTIFPDSRIARSWVAARKVFNVSKK